MDHECHFHVNCWARLLDTHRYTDVYVTFVWCYSRLDFYACFKLTLPLSEFSMYSICEPERLAFIGCLSDLSSDYPDREGQCVERDAIAGALVLHMCTSV